MEATQIRRRIVGGAGTGKTTRLMRILEQTIASGVPAGRVLFCSYTKAAVGEAAARAAEVAGGTPEALQALWFRTIHSAALRCLPKGYKISAEGTAEQRGWLADVFNRAWMSGDYLIGHSRRKKARENYLKNGSPKPLSQPLGHFARSIQIWSTARVRGVTLQEQWDRELLLTPVGFDGERRDNGELQSFARCRRDVRLYEDAKRRDGLLDFVDILARYAGYRYLPNGHFYLVTPEGVEPDIDVAIFDEQQDVSPLADACAKRLSKNAKEVWLAGDPFQAIYGFQGADPELFMSWDVDEQEVMPQSYRCPPRILEVGENILSYSSNYWQRPIKPRQGDEEGEVRALSFERLDWAKLDPQVATFVLARAAFILKDVEDDLTYAGTPWLWDGGRQGGDWSGYGWKVACWACVQLCRGWDIDKYEWAEVVSRLPTAYDGRKMLVRGVKSMFARGKADPDWQKLRGRRSLKQLGDFGATPELIEAIGRGHWRKILNGVSKAEAFEIALEKHGMDLIHNPKIRLSTIHSAKGSEADDVYYVTSGTQASAHAADVDDASRNEEIRLGYVAATRARKRLFLVEHTGGFRAKTVLTKFGVNYHSPVTTSEVQHA